MRTSLQLLFLVAILFGCATTQPDAVEPTEDVLQVKDKDVVLAASDLATEPRDSGTVTADAPPADSFTDSFTAQTDVAFEVGGTTDVLADAEPVLDVRVDHDLGASPVDSGPEVRGDTGTDVPGESGSGDATISDAAVDTDVGPQDTGTIPADTATVSLCNLGFRDCDGNQANGCETRVDGNDRLNCGSCGATCSGSAFGSYCSNGACVCPGVRPLTCSGRCMDGANDTNNCGSCGTVCAMGARCVLGVCTCPGARGGVCSGRCVDLMSDRNNCGSCGTTCVIGCSSGVCLRPVSVALGSNANHACVVMNDTTVRCWGDNNRYQLGGWTAFERGNRVPVLVLSSDGVVSSRFALTGVRQVTIGAVHTCALRVDGSVWCWGDNSYGQVGNGVVSAVMVQTATPVVGTVRATSISAGALHTCALGSDGATRCWGRNDFRALGDGTTLTSPRPVTSGLVNGIQISGGGDTNCAAVPDGTAQCWGYGGYSQLGDGTASARSTPGPVRGVSGVVEVSVGHHTACALLGSGAVWCWGSGINGSIGFGNLPRQVQGLSDAVQISVGYDHVCARLRDATVRCWGRSEDGELGDGVRWGTHPVVSPIGLSNVVQVSAGQTHTCALRTDGVVLCWGGGLFGAATPTPLAW